VTVKLVGLADDGNVCTDPVPVEKNTASELAVDEKPEPDTVTLDPICPPDGLILYSFKFDGPAIMEAATKAITAIELKIN